MEKVTIYLAGASKGLHDESKGWREKAEQIFKNIEEKKEVKIKVINPTRYFHRDGSNSKTDKQVDKFYQSRVRKSDIVLVNLEDTKTSVGTGIELQLAECERIPIVGFGGYNSYELLPCKCDVVFAGINEAIDYISDFYLE